MNTTQVAPAVGDIHSSAKGSGARFNAGKPAYHYLPWTRLSNSILLSPISQEQGYVREALRYLGDFQCGNDYALAHLLVAAGNAAHMSMHEVLNETTKVLDFGAQKYAPFNWAKGMKWSVCIGCIGRHLYGYPTGHAMWHDARSIDPDSGLMHVGHVGANVMFLLEYMSTYREGDDRPQELRTFP